MRPYYAQGCISKCILDEEEKFVEYGFRVARGYLILELLLLYFKKILFQHILYKTVFAY